MLDLLSSMGSVLISWLLLFLVFSGLGIVVLKMLGRSLSSGWNWLDAFWLGWALSLGLLQLWHFIFPVNDVVLQLFAVTAFLLLFLQRKNVTRAIGRLRKDKFFVLIGSVLALWLSNRALGMPIAYDTGFRDMQAVMWIDAYPIVPGLGNLFSSLAFNQSVYLYDALLDASVWSGRSNHIATGLLVFVYLVYTTRAILHLFRCQAAERLRWSCVFAALTLPYVLSYTVTWGGITHFLTDTVIDLVGFITVIYFIDFLQHWRADDGNGDYLIFRLAIVVLTGFTIKQSFLVFGIAIGAYVFVVWLKRCGSRPDGKRLARTILPLGLVACALMIPYLVRGVVTSGYIAYPQTPGRIEVDWAIPVEQLEERQLNMSANTRLRGAERAMVLDSWDWLRPWLRRFVSDIMPTMMPTLIAAVALSLHFVGILRFRGTKLEQRINAWTLLPLLATLTIWFVTFPEPKYVRYVFWSLAALSVLLALLIWQVIPLRKRLYMVVAVAAVCLAYVAYLIIRLETYPLPAGPEGGLYAHWPVQYDDYETDSGLKLNVPTEGRMQCWKIPLPCTPFPNANLEARVAGDLRRGFRISGSNNADSYDA